MAMNLIDNLEKISYNTIRNENYIKKCFYYRMSKYDPQFRVIMIF